MFDNDISLNPQAYAGQNASKTYSLVGWGGDASSIRRVSATALTTPETLTVSHRQGKVNGILTDQHLIRMDLNKNDTLAGPVKLSAWLSLNVPKGQTAITTQDIYDMVGRLIAFEQGANVLTKILNSEP